MFRESNEDKIKRVILKYLTERAMAGVYVDQEYIEAVTRYVIRKIQEKSR